MRAEKNVIFRFKRFCIFRFFFVWKMTFLLCRADTWSHFNKSLFEFTYYRIVLSFWILIRGFSKLYRVSQEKRSIFWEVTVSVILSKKRYMNMCPIPNGFRDRAI